MEEPPSVVVDGADEKATTSNGSTKSLNGSSNSPQHERKLTMWALVFMTYFAVCGGPYGLEDAVGAGYPFFMILGMVIVPWVWSLPIALMTAELSTMIPENGGFVLWVKAAFGNFWAFQEAWWSFVNNLFDLSIYPVMFENYIGSLVPLLPYQAYLIRLGVLLTCFLMNLFGVDVVGKISGVLLVIVLAPFALIIGIGARYIQPRDWLSMPPGNLKDVNWGLFLTTIIWSTGGFDNLSQVAGELKNPNKSYPRAMVIVLIAMIVTVIAPVMVAVSVATDYSKWTDGYFSVVATMLGGEWLHIVMVIGACVSSLGVLNAYLCTCSEMLAAWGEKDLLSLKFLQAQSRWKTPYVALLINSFLIAIGTILPFEFLVQMDQLYYSIGLALEYFSLIYLRFKSPDRERPFRIPMHKYVLTGYILIPVAFCAFTVVTPLIQPNWLIRGIVAGVMTFGVVIYPLVSWWQKRVAAKETEETQRLIN